MYFRTCPRCGANLDPGEICECNKKGRPANGHSRDGMGNRGGFPKNVQFILPESSRSVKPDSAQISIFGGYYAQFNHKDTDGRHEP